VVSVLPATIGEVPVRPAQPPEAWETLFLLGETVPPDHPVMAVAVVAVQEVTALAEMPMILPPEQERLLVVVTVVLDEPGAALAMMAISQVAVVEVVMQAAIPTAQGVMEQEDR
jgi:hypothetical protein